MVTFPHAVLSVAAEYKIIGALPALIKLVASVAQFAIALAVTMFMFCQSAPAHYIKHAGGEIGKSIQLLVSSLSNGSPRWFLPSTGTLKERIITHMKLQKST